VLELKLEHTIDRVVILNDENPKRPAVFLHSLIASVPPKKRRPHWKRIKDQQPKRCSDSSSDP